MADSIDSIAITESLAVSEVDLDPRLVALGREYMEALRAGKRPDRKAFLTKIPDLGEVAEDTLDGIELAFSLELAKDATSIQSDRQDFLNRNEPIGEFRLIREIGRGGMGTVYEAQQASLGRHVALKVLPFAAALDERHRKRFLLEAQAAAQLHHNHIVPVYAVGCDRGTHYYAMQLIDGRAVSSGHFCEPMSQAQSSPRMSETSLDCAGATERHSDQSLGFPRRMEQDRFRRIAAVIADAAEGLDYAHSCGIVHRDIKPGNLLLDTKGKVWITDFGLAHIAVADQLTRTGEMLGTLRYMSPEQASGSRGMVDHRSDVYSLGATLYELLCDHPVFDGCDRQSLLNQILKDEPRPLRQFDRTIPEELEVVALKALRHSPAERYETAQHFADDLRRFLSEIPITARPPTFIERTRKWMRRHPSIALSLVFTLGFAMVLFALTTLVVGHQKSLTQERAASAERRLEIAQAAADEMIHLAEHEFSNSPMEETLRLRLLSSALSYYQSLLDEPGLAHEIEAELRVTRDQVARAHTELSLRRDDRDLALLGNPAVVADLNLSDHQRKQLSAISFSRRQPTGDFEFVQKRQDAVATILEPVQRQRLKQIAMQLRGPSAIIELSYSGDLDLSENQVSAIRRAIIGQILTRGERELSARINQAFSEGSSASPDKRLRPDDLLTDEMKQHVMNVACEQLTTEQFRKWRELTGAPFAPE